MNKLLVERLKKLRTESEISQAKFANILGVAQSTIAAWEVGRNEPDSEMLIRLANFFKVSVDYLIGYSNDMYTNDNENRIPRAAARSRSSAPQTPEKKIEPFIPPQPTMHYVHVPMRGGKDKEIFLTDEKFKEWEETLNEAGNKHYEKEKNREK